MDVNFFKKSQTKEKISIDEAFNIWELLRARYNSLETVYFYINLVHDKDFELVLNNLGNAFKKQIEELERLAKKYSVKVPHSPAHEIKVSLQLDQVTDKYIFRKIYGDLIYELYSLNKALTSTTFNDELRNIFYDFILEHLNEYRTIYKYGKVKGWTNVSPSFKTFKPEKHEDLSLGEATHLWHHINLRYDQIHLTNIYLQFIHDVDLKVIFNEGLSVLNKQAQTLEEKANEYEVPLPEKPPAVNEASIDPEIMEDKFAYRTILNGIQSAIDLHIRAVIETTRNDSLRRLFMEFFKKEVDIFNKFLKYGKAKGWTHITPTYKET